MGITVEREGNTARQPAPDVTPGPTFRIASGFMAAKQLFVANEVGCSRSTPKDRLPWTSWRGAAALLGAPSGSWPTPWLPLTCRVAWSECTTDAS